MGGGGKVKGGAGGSWDPQRGGARLPRLKPTHTKRGRSTLHMVYNIIMFMISM